MRRRCAGDRRRGRPGHGGRAPRRAERLQRRRAWASTCSTPWALSPLTAARPGWGSATRSSWPSSSGSLRRSSATSSTCWPTPRERPRSTPACTRAGSRRSRAARRPPVDRLVDGQVAPLPRGRRIGTAPTKVKASNRSCSEPAQPVTRRSEGLPGERDRRDGGRAPRRRAQRVLAGSAGPAARRDVGHATGARPRSGRPRPDGCPTTRTSPSSAPVARCGTVATVAGRAPASSSCATRARSRSTSPAPARRGRAGRPAVGRCARGRRATSPGRQCCSHLTWRRGSQRGQPAGRAAAPPAPTGPVRGRAPAALRRVRRLLDEGRDRGIVPAGRRCDLAAGRPRPVFRRHRARPCATTRCWPESTRAPSGSRPGLSLGRRCGWNTRSRSSRAVSRRRQAGSLGQTDLAPRAGTDPAAVDVVATVTARVPCRARPPPRSVRP